MGGASLAGVVLGALLGAAVGIGGYTFVYARGYSYLIDDPQACMNCHVMREQFDGWLKSSHRSVATCNSCHRTIDPPGFALESFDVMGGWRDRYRAFAENVKAEPGIGLSGQPFTFHYGLPVDSAGVLSDGRAFKDIREFKRLLLEHEEGTVARNLVGQLATYGTGAPISFADRKTVQEILDKTRSSGYGVRDIVHGIVASDLFRNK